MSAGRAFRELLSAEKCLVLPGVFNALGARVMEAADVPCVYMSGFSVSTSMLGRPDLGMLGLTEMAEAGARIAAAVDIPVLADADTGYGGSFTVKRTVEEYERAGLAGMHIEDQDLETKRCGHLGEISLAPEEVMLERLRAALHARRDDGFFIIARTDARRAHGLEEALRRAELLAAEGPDAIFVEYLTDPDEVRKVRQTVDLPIVTTVIDSPDAPDVDALSEAGADIVLFPVSLLRSFTRGAARIAEALKSTRSTATITSEFADMADVEAAIRLADMQAWEAGVRQGSRSRRERPMISGLHHANIIVSDIERAKSFYTKTLGLEVAMETEIAEEEFARGVAIPGTKVKAMFLAIPETPTLIEIFEYVSPGPGKPISSDAAANDIGVGHVAFQVADIDAAVADLEGKGVEFLSTPVSIPESHADVGGVRFCYFSDPDGTLLELIEIPGETQ